MDLFTPSQNLFLTYDVARHYAHANILQPVLESVSTHWSKTDFKPVISVDTHDPVIIEKALHYSIDWINDVSGETCDAIARLIAGTALKYVCMHSLSIPANPNHIIPGDPIQTVYTFGEQRLAYLQKQGLLLDQCIFDIGIGFGKNALQSLTLLQSIAVFKKLGVPLMVGHSRKSFLSLLTSAPPTRS